MHYGRLLFKRKEEGDGNFLHSNRTTEENDNIMPSFSFSLQHHHRRRQQQLLLLPSYFLQQNHRIK
jgi:hypothetical protein